VRSPLGIALAKLGQALAPNPSPDAPSKLRHLVAAHRIECASRVLEKVPPDRRRSFEGLARDDTPNRVASRVLRDVQNASDPTHRAGQLARPVGDLSKVAIGAEPRFNFGLKRAPKVVCVR
jgi:hypothetical protein